MSALDWTTEAVPPLFVQAFETIMGRIIADLNAGIDPTSALFLDMTPGSIPSDLFSAVVLELDRMYDKLGNEVVRAAIPTFSFGPYLDSWAESFGDGRKDAAAASGQLTFTGDTGTVVEVGMEASTISSEPGVDPQTFATTAGGVVDASNGDGTGIVTLAAAARNAGGAGNVLANTVTVITSAAAGLSAVTNLQPFTMGADVETDQALQTRVGNIMSGTKGAGTISDYEQWFSAIPGVGFVSVQPNWNGPTTVRVMVRDQNGASLSAAAIATLQAQWDPGANGDGAAQGPAGHLITIASPIGQGVLVDATIAFEDGYSYDGAGGTIAIRQDLIDSAQAYFATLAAGDPVVWYKVAAALVDVPGVKNLSNLRLVPVGTVGGTSTVPVGASAVPLVDAFEFHAGDTIVLGYGGTNQENATVLTVSGNTLNLTASTTHPHPVGDPVLHSSLITDMTVGPNDVATLFALSLS